MKKFLTAAAGIAAGYALWIQVQKKTQDRAVWQEVTDPIE
ncbi:MAG: DLW-39 family protein [Actinomycetaceae bacterium]|nr:DLW-39 family protein [Actinomycetaceae bacterium]